MRHLELHILQSVPVACLNRDDFGSPKPATFGGVQRARVSSQSWKRAIRELAQEMAPEAFIGQRTRLIIEPLCASLQAKGFSGQEAMEGAKKIAEAINKYGRCGKEVSGQGRTCLSRQVPLFYVAS